MREKARRLLQHGGGLVEHGHSHSIGIKSWVSAIDRQLKDFATRIEKRQTKLEMALGLHTDESGVSIL